MDCEKTWSVFLSQSLMRIGTLSVLITNFLRNMRHEIIFIMTSVQNISKVIGTNKWDTGKVNHWNQIFFLPFPAFKVKNSSNNIFIFYLVNRKIFMFWLVSIQDWTISTQKRSCCVYMYLKRIIHSHATQNMIKQILCFTLDDSLKFKVWN